MSIKIDIHDVVVEGSVEAAIIAACERSDTAASGVIGPSFSCSGPGSGWQRNHDVNDFAERALADDYGACSYIDASDGREATLGKDGDLTWSEESVVECILPSTDEALESPHEMALMAVAVRDYHSPASDARGWDDLVSSIQAAGEKLEGVAIFAEA